MFKLNQIRQQFGEVLSRKEMMKILGGELPPLEKRCAIYCCVGPGNCSASLTFNYDCTSNEECQDIAINQYNATCPDENAFVAALCKG